MNSAKQGVKSARPDLGLIDEINRCLFGNHQIKSFYSSGGRPVNPEKYALATSFASLLCSDAASVTSHHLNILLQKLTSSEILLIAEHVASVINKPKIFQKIKKMLK